MVIGGNSNTEDLDHGDDREMDTESESESINYTDTGKEKDNRSAHDDSGYLDDNSTPFMVGSEEILNPSSSELIERAVTSERMMALGNNPGNEPKISTKKGSRNKKNSKGTPPVQ